MTQDHDDRDRPELEDEDHDHPAGRPRRPAEAADSAPWTALLGLQAFGNEAATQLLGSTEIAACYLDQIAQHTCGIYNEAHWQTELQRALGADVQAVKELLESAFPAAALERARHGEAARRVEQCCPPAKPEPICEPRLCPPGAERGEHGLQHGEAAAVHVEGAPYPPFEIVGEVPKAATLITTLSLRPVHCAGRWLLSSRPRTFVTTRAAQGPEARPTRWSSMWNAGRLQGVLKRFPARHERRVGQRRGDDVG